MNHLLELRELDAFYGNTQVLFGLNLALEAGGITAILGANGAGKTTTLRAVCRAIRTRGDIWFDGQSANAHSTENLVRLGVAHVPDGRGTFSQLSVEDNLRLGAYTRGNTRDVSDDMERAYARFPKLKDRRHQQAGTLSGGEQQMLAISRALMLKPRLLLLDEPSFGVAPRTVIEIFDVLDRIHREEGVTMLLVEQDASLALEFADQAYLLETGRVILSGPASVLAEDEIVRRSYLGY